MDAVGTVRGLAARFWWLLLVRGIIAVLFGIIALAAPGAALSFLIALLAVYFIFDGVTSIMHGFSERGSGKSTAWYYIQGILGIVAGIITLAWPGATALVLLFIIGFWAIVGGITAIGSAWTLRKTDQTNGWLWMLITGILALIFGVTLVVSPFDGILSILWLIGIWALISGIFLIMAAFTLKSAGKGASA
ncbi:HdeD family acid-resistance protein [Nakamurella sp. YIM 132087]|uniref:HdeD family acid-resistance protein n=1 Tax=Nakamurella alba TaxID=2665158 RepID=A0A7K1FS72_9ACTN|nr:HdeD family acid-resistance protein [Nakamurella alba]MTD16219.1 HdeD family acid-resistance protein [Nakamurella alba]